MILACAPLWVTSLGVTVHSEVLGRVEELKEEGSGCPVLGATLQGSGCG